MRGQPSIVSDAIDEGVIDRLRAARRVCVLTGAGVSAESGVPTFRGRDGVWEKYDPSELATVKGFERDPAKVWEWYRLRQRVIAASQPNAAHRVISAMEQRYPSFMVLTQNVDGLHQRAGSSSVVELHGSIWRTRCSREGIVAPVSSPIEDIPPVCRCGALLRPDVTWFGEALDRAALESAVDAAQRADAMFVVGTSSAVYPAAALPELTKQAGGAVIEVNLQPTPLSALADASLLGDAGVLLQSIWSRIANPKGL
jgi:NAD-dependent deacetylase